MKGFFFLLSLRDSARGTRIMRDTREPLQARRVTCRQAPGIYQILPET